METQLTAIKKDLENVKLVLGNLIAWLYSELGEHNAKALLEQLNKDTK